MPTTNTTSAEWGMRYRQARLSKGLTQMELSAIAGVHQAVVSRVENGAGISMRNHVRIATALGVTLDAILRDAA